MLLNQSENNIDNNMELISTKLKSTEDNEFKLEIIDMLTKYIKNNNSNINTNKIIIMVNMLLDNSDDIRIQLSLLNFIKILINKNNYIDIFNQLLLELFINSNNNIILCQTLDVIY